MVETVLEQLCGGAATLPERISILSRQVVALVTCLQSRIARLEWENAELRDRLEVACEYRVLTAPTETQQEDKDNAG